MEKILTVKSIYILKVDLLSIYNLPIIYDNQVLNRKKSKSE